VRRLSAVDRLGHIKPLMKGDYCLIRRRVAPELYRYRPPAFHYPLAICCKHRRQSSIGLGTLDGVTGRPAVGLARRWSPLTLMVRTESGEACSKPQGETTMEYYAGIDVSFERSSAWCRRRTLACFRDFPKKSARALMLGFCRGRDADGTGK
jgi:hypothetical protein